MLRVPLGTVVSSGDGRGRAPNSSAPASAFVDGTGGDGAGSATRALASTRRKAPGSPCSARPATGKDLILELKSVANMAWWVSRAGKSSLSPLSPLRGPKIADYPFATLDPNLGVVQSRRGHDYTVADVPGLIEGAAKSGLGLRVPAPCRALHRRCCTSLDLRDPGARARPAPVTSTPSSQSWPSTLAPKAISSARLRSRSEQGGCPRRVARLAELVASELAESRGCRSSRSGGSPCEGCASSSSRSARRSRPLARGGRRGAGSDRQSGRTAVNEAGVHGRTRVPGGRLLRDVFSVRGVKPERWVRQTDFDNDEAVGYSPTGSRLGVEDELAQGRRARRRRRRDRRNVVSSTWSRR